MRPSAFAQVVAVLVASTLWSQQSGSTLLAVNANIGSPIGIATDPTGNVYFSSLNCVFKIESDGVLKIVAGNGIAGESGDGGPASSAQLSNPTGLAFDSAGSLYVVDAATTYNARIRKISASGIITTVAGGGALCTNTQCPPNPNGDGGSATSALLIQPTDVAVDGSGDIYIVEPLDADGGAGISGGNGRVREVSTLGIINTFAGGGTETSVWAYSTDTDGLGDGGPATSALLSSPSGLAVDSVGNLYIADTNDARIRKASPGLIPPMWLGNPDPSQFVPGIVIDRVAGTGTPCGSAVYVCPGYSGDGGLAINAQLSGPVGVTVDGSGNLYIADSFNNRIRRVASDGIITTVAGTGQSGYSGDGGPALAAQLANPISVANDAAGNLYFVDSKNARIRKVSVDGTISTIGGGGVSNPLTASSQAPSISPDGVVPLDSTVSTIQPGEWVSIYGTNLASSTATWTGNFPISLGGTSVTIDGRPAYLSFVSFGQIDLQAPDDPTTGTVPVVVTTANGSAASSVTLAPFAPSFLLLDAKHVAGIIPRSNGAGAYGGGTYDILGPTGTSLGYPTVAAKPGDVVELFATGLGATNPAVQAGQAFSSPAPTTNQVSLLINNATVMPEFAGLSGAGLDQINVTVPPGVGTGDVPLIATVSGVQTQAGVVISLAGTQPTGFSGFWTFTAQSSLYGFQSEASGQLTQNGNNISGQLNLSGTPCATSAAVSGTVSGEALSIILNENGQQVTFTGAVSADGNSASGTYAAPAGGCTDGDYGTWSGDKN